MLYIILNKSEFYVKISFNLAGRPKIKKNNNNSTTAPLGGLDSVQAPQDVGDRVAQPDGAGSLASLTISGNPCQAALDGLYHGLDPEAKKDALAALLTSLKEAAEADGGFPPPSQDDHEGDLEPELPNLVSDEEWSDSDDEPSPAAPKVFRLSSKGSKKKKKKRSRVASSSSSSSSASGAHSDESSTPKKPKYSDENVPSVSVSKTELGKSPSTPFFI